MLAEWSAECSSEDPVLVVPWKDADSDAAFVDLRANPYDFDGIVEAERHPPVMQALRALNAARSPVFTAKCDAWAMGDEEVRQMQAMLDWELDGGADGAGCGFASYIDMVWRGRSVFPSFAQHERIVRRLVRLAEPLEHPAAALECVVRPAVVDLDGVREGFAVSVYVKALGGDAVAAEAEWAGALDAVVGLIRKQVVS
jgi:hypothetical protein